MNHCQSNPSFIDPICTDELIEAFFISWIDSLKACAKLELIILNHKKNLLILTSCQFVKGYHTRRLRNHILSMFIFTYFM